jgi:cytochrome P450
MVVWLLVSLFIALAVTHWVWLRNKYQTKYPLPPGPLAFPLIGNLHQLLLSGRDPFITGFQNLLRKFGPIIYLKLPVLGNVVVIGDALTAHQIAMQAPEAMSLRMFEGFSLEEGTDNYSDVLTGNGEVWKTQRKRLVKGVIQNLPRTEKIVVKCFNQFAENVGKRVDTDIMIFPELRSLTFDVITEIVGGRCLPSDAQKQKYLKAVDQLGGYMMPFHPRNMFPILRYFPDYKDGFRKVIGDQFGFLESMLASHRAHPLEEGKDSEVDKDFVDELLDQVVSNELSIAQFRQLVGDCYGGGMETFASTISNFLGFIALDQNFQRRLQEQLDSVLGQNGTPSIEVLDRLPLLTCAVKETLRMIPTTPFTQRYTPKELELLGYTIPAGTHIMFHWYSISRSRRHFKEPNQFLPERFLNEEKELTIRGSEMPKDPETMKFTPFGFGKRSCAGIQLAKVEIFLAAAILAHRFTWLSNPVNPIDMRQKFEFFSKPLKPIVLRARRRN